MSFFRQRPLTSLFIAASVLLDLVLPAAGDGEAWLYAFVSGQSLALGGWLALGHMHRLLRGAAYIALAAGLALLIETRTSERIELNHGEWIETYNWGYNLIIIFALSAGAAVSSGLWAALVRRVWRASSAETKRPWRFPMSELLAWTAVVAVAAFILRAGEWAELGEDVNVLLMIATTTFIAGLVMAVLLAKRSGSVLLRGALSIVAIAVVFAVAESIDPSIDPTSLAMFAGMYGYVLLWIVVQRLDWRLARRESRADELFGAPAIAHADGMLEVCPPSANDR